LSTYRASSLYQARDGASQARALTSVNMKLRVCSSRVDQLVKETVYQLIYILRVNTRILAQALSPTSGSSLHPIPTTQPTPYILAGSLLDSIGTGGVLRSGQLVTPNKSLTTPTSRIMCDNYCHEVVAIPVTTLRFLLGSDPSDGKWTLTEFRDCCIHTLGCPS